MPVGISAGRRRGARPVGRQRGTRSRCGDLADAASPGSMRPCAGARGTFWTEKRLPLLSPGGVSHSSAHSHLGGALLTRKIPGRARIKAVTGMAGAEARMSARSFSPQSCALRVATADSAGTVNAEVGYVDEGEHSRIALAVDQKMDLTVVRRFHRSAKAPCCGLDQEFWLCGIV